MKRRALLLAGLGVGAAAASAAGIGALDRDDAANAASREAPKHRSVATVRRTDLVDRQDLDGTLGYGAATDVTVGRTGTITALPAVGVVVERGAAVAEVDGRPVPLFVGTRPLWRKLTADPVGPDGQPADQLTGPDVRIVEENLQALGFVTATGPAAAKVDDTFTGSTAEAVKAWQRASGLPVTGAIEPTDVVVQPGAVRVATHVAQIGAPSGSATISVTAVDRRITVPLATTRRDLVAVGDEVSVTLPDHTVAPATITSVADTVSPGDPQQGTPDTVEVIVTLQDPAAAGDYDSAPVTVAVERGRAERVLAVPVAALLALSEGGYAVERVAGDGTTLVAVSIGAFADGLVEVDGDGLAEGDEVVVPS